MARVSAWSKLTRGGCGPTLAQCLRQKNQGPGKATRVVFNVFSMMAPAVCLSQLGCADRNVRVLFSVAEDDLHDLFDLAQVRFFKFVWDSICPVRPGPRSN